MYDVDGFRDCSRTSFRVIIVIAVGFAQSTEAGAVDWRLQQGFWGGSTRERRVQKFMSVVRVEVACWRWEHWTEISGIDKLGMMPRAVSEPKPNMNVPAILILEPACLPEC